MNGRDLHHKDVIRRNVLAICNKKLSQRLMKDVFSRFGCTMVLIHDNNVKLGTPVHKTFSLVMIDDDWLRGNGRQLLRGIREKGDTTPAIIMKRKAGRSKCDVTRLHDIDADLVIYPIVGKIDHEMSPMVAAIFAKENGDPEQGEAVGQ